MTYNDIIEWILENYDFEANEDARAAFNTISKDWKDDNRDSLANTLGDEKESFIKRLQDIIPTTDQIDPQYDQRINAVERGINELFTEFGQIIRGRESIVLPKGYIAIEPDIIAREEIKDENILTKVFNFIKGIFS